MFGSPAALVGVAHDDAAAKARVEVKSDCVGVVTDVDGEPEDRETDALRHAWTLSVRKWFLATVATFGFLSWGLKDNSYLVILLI